MAPDNHKWTNLIRKIREDVSTKPVSIITRESAEKSAKTLLENKSGSFNTTALVNFRNLYENVNRNIDSF